MSYSCEDSDHDTIHDILNIITEQGSAGQVLAKSSVVNGQSASGALLEYINLPDTSTLLSRSGGTMTGVIAMNSNKITTLGTPTAGTDAATKSYVDAHPSVAPTTVQTFTHSTAGALATLNATAGHTIVVTVNANVSGFGTWGTWLPGQFATIWFINPSGSGVSRVLTFTGLTALPNETLSSITLAPGGVYMLTVTSHNWSTRQYAYSGVLMEAGA
jgi:hypothetical protein